MKKIAFLSNHFITLYAFRKELIEELLNNSYDVYLLLPPASENEYFEKLGCTIVEINVDRRGTNPLSDLKLTIQYSKALKKINPDLVLSYTIKPNIYGGIASKINKKKVIHTITGLGSVYIREMWQNRVAASLNRIAFENAETLVFLNEDNKEFYKEKGIIDKNSNILIVPGSGVNLDKFKYNPLLESDIITFTFIGRVLKDKGIEEFLSAAKKIKNKYSNIVFQVVGFVDEEKYNKLLERYENDGTIIYLGKREDIAEIITSSSCIVLPSYGEGRGTVLQEGAAIGRPLITTNTYGCRENVEDEYNGYLCEVADEKSLEDSFEKFIKLSFEEKKLMGRRSRLKAEKEFDRQKVMNIYIKEINKLVMGEK